MSSFFQNVERHFNSYYTKIYGECLTSSKAKKDIVGAAYESWKRKWVKSYSSLDVATAEEVKQIKTKYKIDFNADIYIVNADTRDLVALEEDKGHYVDKCFFKRALANAVDSIVMCLAQNMPVPYFILSCPTNYSKAEEIKNFQSMSLKPEIYKLLEDKFMYFPLCLHGRVNRTAYLKQISNPFDLCGDLCYDQHSFYEQLHLTKEN